MSSEIPEPAGFQLRDLRSSKSQNASDWTHVDALYDAYVETGKSAPQDALVVAWFAKGEKPGTVRLEFRAWSTNANDARALAAAMNIRMNAPSDP